jgi:hypothetical protein
MTKTIYSKTVANATNIIGFPGQCAPLDYYEKHGFALLRVFPGGKNPMGNAWQDLSSKDPREWALWKAQNCNIGVLAGASRIITVDLDTTKEGGRDGVWGRYVAWCQANGLPVYEPHVSTARQGMHIYFRLPDGVDAMALKVNAKKLGAGIDVLVGNKQSVAAGSFYYGTAKGETSGSYVLMSVAPPHPAPAALIEHCTPAAPRVTAETLPGTYDKDDVAALLAWMDAKGMFAEYEDYCEIGMALKIECPDDGFELWATIFDGTVTETEAADKWRSFASEARPGGITLKTFFKRAKDAGWTGSVRPSAASMFPGVAAGTSSPQPSTEQESFTQVTLDDFLAYLPVNKYIYLPDRTLWLAVTINTTLAPVEIGTKDVKKPNSDEVETKPVTIPPSKWLNRNKGIACMTWAPGHPVIIHGKAIHGDGWIENSNSTTFNEYREPTMKRIPGDPSPWINHVKRLCGEHSQHFLYYCAHRVQRPAEKINHAIVLGGGQGIGKDTLLEPLKAAVGPWNFKEASPVTMMAPFDPYKKCVVLRINEARDLGDMTRHEFYERIKNLSAAPPDVLPVNQKHLPEVYVPNVCGVIVTTNHPDAIALPSDDRRFFVIWSHLTKEDFTEQYWIDLWAWFDGGGIEIVADHLANMDLSGFNPKAYPLHTEAWHQMVGFSAAPEDAELADAIDLLGKPDAITVGCIVKRLGVVNGLSVFLQERRNSRSVPARFKKCEYVPVRNAEAKSGLWSVKGKRQAVYAKAGLSERERIAAAATLATGALPPPLPY